MKAPCPNCLEYMKFFVHFVAPKKANRDNGRLPFTSRDRLVLGLFKWYCKNSRMGNFVGNGLYHLQSSFKVTERVWREVKSWEYANVHTFSDWKFRLGILDYLSKNPVFSGNFFV